jgi:hypothetical protein
MMGAMHARLPAFLAFGLVCGCSSPPPDAKAVAFQSAMSAFVAECQSICRYLEDFPDQPLYGQKLRSAADLYTRIPDAPPGRQPLVVKAKEIRDLLQETNDTVNSVRFWAIRVGDPDTRKSDAKRADDRDSMNKSLESCHRVGREAKRMLGQIEAALTSPPPP